ncbi:MAG: tRNA (adenosine(37)-N6)-threonylcarbamoyltransferase complex ATPase subunit type 1 TsaE [Verrucomicrobiaceae bacterium]|nr:tRNA (adenosine(37)-N6)-threonylcarbamoyltransferase complex ATPase subunit type 1 TsaE [Verrucomicrobiaceae bacterium]
MTEHLESAEATIHWGKRLAATLRGGDVIALIGGLGAGKTHASKGIVEGLGCAAEVTSPTFTLVHEYRGGKLPIFHFDLYRVETAQELLEIGWDEMMDESGIMLVEWADRFPELLPASARWFELKVLPEGGRSVTALQNPSA